jgi:hypothetical protein
MIHNFDPENSLSAVIRQALADCPDSMYELGRASNVTPASISRFKNRERSLSLRSAERLCVPLGLRLVRRVAKRTASEQPKLVQLEPVASIGEPVPVDELQEIGTGDPAIPRAVGEPSPFEQPGIDPLADGPGRDIAIVGDLAGRE